MYVYNTSDVSIYHQYQIYETQAYKADDFYTVMRLVNIPDIAVAVDSANENLINLEDYARHITYDVSELTYSILINSSTDARVSIDENNNIDINPVAGFSGFSDVTIEVKYQDGFRTLDTAMSKTPTPRGKVWPGSNY